MTLETKLSFVNKWRHVDALNCWVEYHKKYEAKYGGALAQAMYNGTSHEYIKRECEVFRRYAQMWKYHRL